MFVSYIVHAVCLSVSRAYARPNVGIHAQVSSIICPIVTFGSFLSPVCVVFPSAVKKQFGKWPFTGRLNESAILIESRSLSAHFLCSCCYFCLFVFLLFCFICFLLFVSLFASFFSKLNVVYFAFGAYACCAFALHGYSVLPCSGLSGLDCTLFCSVLFCSG